ncbi:MAG TPA: TonB-dependent receptor [Candidatus Baltobacteraceae bacterium]
MSLPLHLRVLCSLVLFAFVATTSTLPAGAGTTGSVSGQITDADSHAPIVDATVSVTSPSQNATSTTDASGKFLFISLAPDTYTVSVQKTGYGPVAVGGISVFADQNQSLPLSMHKSLKEIANVTSRSSLSPVKSGTVTDVYSVNPEVARAAAPIGGGGGLNNAYSAIASMPGAFVPNGQMGVNQTVYIRGGYYDQIGYEYDGVPVNRSFDNYPAHSASSLGQQELQIYTGGGPASSNATGLAGFINQVVKSGTYPGTGSASARLGSPTFYHDLSVEAGGASPNRLFSYYAGLSGFNQDFRYLDNQNGAGLASEFPVTYPSNITTNLAFWPSVYPTCDPANANLYDNPAVDSGMLFNDPGCFSYLNPNYGNIAMINGREAVANLHFGIPHKNDGGRDDIQLLYTNSSQYRQYYASVNDAGPIVPALLKIGFVGAPQWPDFYTYPSGTKFLAPADAPVIGYMFPGSPSNRCVNQTGLVDNSLPIPNACADATVSALPNDYRDARWDSASIVKLQYQHNMGSRAYLRLFGYTFYSNTNRSGAVQEGVPGANLGITNFDYEVNAHTRGGQLQFADQITDTNQISANLNYVTSSTLRYYNFNNFNTGTQQVSSLTNGTRCFAAADGTLQNGIESVNAGDAAPCNDPITQGSFEAPTSFSNAGNPENVNCSGGSNDPIPANACANGAAWGLTFTGNQASINSVTPKFLNFALTDEWKPNDKLDINASVRFDRDEFDLTPVNSTGKNFWYAAAQKEFCYNPQTFQPVTVPEPPQFLKSINPYVSYNCPLDPTSGVQTVHPDGQGGHILLTDNFNPTYVQTYSEPRLGLTYSINSDTVLRFSAGRFAQEPQNYEVEYNSLEPNLAAQLIGFLPYGFNTPFHSAGAQFSNNVDFSYERHFKGTDMSLKLTPYFRYATDQLYETVNIPTLFGVSPSFNAGTERTSGIELEFTKGDFNRNGLAGIFSYTYTNSKEKWRNFQGVSINPVDPYNQDIQNFNALTKAGGGAQCYANTIRKKHVPSSAPQVVADPSCQPYVDPASGFAYNSPILNPYYNMAPQPLFDKFGYYDTGLDYPYISPNTFAVILNYRHDKFSLTPAFTLNQGATYGTPADVQGLDPRTCRANQGDDGIPNGNPLAADYTSCGSAAIGSSGSSPGHLYVPNPAIGKFDGFGQYRQPWQLNVGLQMSYELSPKITANLTVANLLNRCFGGSSTPWTKQYAPNASICGYGYNKFYISNYYNGASPNDTAANGVPLNPFFAQPFTPAYGDTNSGNLPLPLQLYFQVQVKL